MSDGALPVTLYGTDIGVLDRVGGRSLFTWSPAAEQRWGLNSPALSRNLRVGKTDAGATESFFGALLPEGQWLVNLARDVKVTSSDLVGLFTEVGADLAGALTVGAGRKVGEPHTIDEQELGLLLEQASGFLMGGGGSALPGFQRKLTLTRRGGRWIAGNGGVASTHILKPVSSELRATVEGESYVLAIARELGLADFDAWVEDIAGRAVLVVERYDRIVRGGDVDRIHQEDFAQALGLPWGGNAKFEHSDPRASLKEIAQMLDSGRTIFDRSAKDIERLLRYTVLNVAAGNTDAHAKNFALLHPADAKPHLAPYYDSAPLALAYGASTALAMRIAGQSQLPDITVDHLVEEARSWGIPETDAHQIVSDELSAIIDATRSLTAHPSIEAHIPGYIRGQAQNLLDGKPARIVNVAPLMALPRIGSAQPRVRPGEP